MGASPVNRLKTAYPLVASERWRCISGEPPPCRLSYGSGNYNYYPLHITSFMPTPKGTK